MISPLIIFAHKVDLAVAGAKRTEEGLEADCSHVSKYSAHYQGINFDME